ncbi:hypothetical protein PARHAE_03284 [Paracoccus haematequi]|uniref:Uncharacterized protein n=1 Tax=Paracoccus haematequi TaxID=2491866 RepID=A0A3S4DDP5_9RHOB|nr:hypothetical protein [Paracoccus haematequi]VDS10073.1 hypothetical protein PARHAE_03284 [Paracoccus haematequi]
MKKDWNAAGVAKAIEGYGHDDIPDAIDQAILSVGPGASFQAFVQALRVVRTGIDTSF